MEICPNISYHDVNLAAIHASKNLDNSPKGNPGDYVRDTLPQ